MIYAQHFDAEKFREWSVTPVTDLSKFHYLASGK